MNQEALRENISLEVKVTDRCNQSCFHCMNSDGLENRGENLDCYQFVKKLTQWSESYGQSPYQINEIRMTGGEPLLNLEGVITIAKACQSLQIRSGINTNGTFLDESVASILREAKLETVKISFDSLDEAILRKMRGPQASLSKTLAGIRNSIDFSFQTILRFTLC